MAARRCDDEDAPEVELPLPEFVPSKWKYITESPKIVLVAQSNTGKSVALDYLVGETVGVWDMVVAFSKTEPASGNWARRIVRGHIHHEFKPKIIRRIIEKNKERMSEGKKPVRTLIILDDVLSDETAMKHPIVLELFIEARNYAVGVAITAQDIFLIPKKMRTNVQLWMFFRDFGEVNRKAIHRITASAIRPFDLFESVFTACTSNYRVFMVDRGYNGDAQWGPFHFYCPKELPDKCTCNPDQPLEQGQCPKCGAYKVGKQRCRSYVRKHHDPEGQAAPPPIASMMMAGGRRKGPQYSIVLTRRDGTEIDTGGGKKKKKRPA
jgi:hypothetical protein